MAGLFKFFFKYPALVFEQGEFTFAASRSMTLGLALLAAVAVAALITYRGITSEGPTRDRAVLVALRLGVVALLLFCLFRPSLILKAAVPQQNFLGILIDDSRSMTIADSDGKARTDFVQQQLSQPDSPLLTALSQRFVLRFFRFSSSADRLAATGDLKYAGTATHLGQALERARDELAGLPLAGPRHGHRRRRHLRRFARRAAGHAESAVDPGVPDRRRPGAFRARHSGHPRGDAALDAEGHVAGRRRRHHAIGLRRPDGAAPRRRRRPHRQLAERHDAGDGQSTTVRVSFTTADAGPRLFRFRIEPQPDEQVTQNNARDALVEVSDRKERVLYMEGEPRFEAKFVRRAVEDDANLQVTILQRTAEDKYLRLDVGSPDELVGGFPKTREELFAYRAIILGSVEAASFSPDQLRMLADFVSKRGGGLLMLGGRRAFAEGGWAGTPVAEVLPVEFETGGRAQQHRAVLHAGLGAADAGGRHISR